MVRKVSVQPLFFASSVYYPDKNILGKDVEVLSKLLEEIDGETKILLSPRLVESDASLEEATAALGQSLPLLIPLSGGIQKKMIAAAEAASESLLWTWFPQDDIFSGEIAEVVGRVCSRNALPAVADVWAALRNQGRRVQKVYSGTSWRAASLDLERVNGVRSSRILLVGYTQEWVVSASVDTREMERRLGISSVHIGLEELFAEYDACASREEEAASLAEEYAGCARERLEPSSGQLQNALRLYLALKNLLLKYGCNAMAISCFSLAKTLGVTACTALSLINDEPGTIAACEGDLDAAVSMIVGKAVTGLPVFMGNPVYSLKNTLDIVHCTAPRRLLTSAVQPYDLRSHHETGLSVSQRVEVSGPADATIFRIGDEFRRAVVFEAPLLDNPRLDTCRTQFRFGLKDWERTFDQMLGCHHMVIFGRHAEVLVSFLKDRLKLEVTVL